MGFVTATANPNTPKFPCTVVTKKHDSAKTLITLDQPAGRSLIAGSILTFVTMALHPSGGSLEHIVRIYHLIVFSHALAILSLPLLTMGFWGLSTRLLTPGGLSLLAFFTVLFGLVAVMLAGLFNGLVLPFFAARQLGQTGAALNTVKLIVHYGSTINRALDYVFIAAIFIAIGLWSGLILQTNRLPRWLGYGGLLLVGVVGLGAITRFDFIGLAGFRLLIFGLVGWIVSAGFALSRKSLASVNPT